MPSGENHFIDEQVRRNLLSNDRWQAYATHRGEVTRRLLGRDSSDGEVDAKGRLCVLGAGNCNDLDLARLATAFREIHLVDLDGEALARGVARQANGPAGAVHQHGRIDLLGTLDALAHWSGERQPTEAEVEICLARVNEPPVDSLHGPFEVVASVCLVSQLIECAVVSLGEGHPRFAEFVLAIRAAHLRLLVRLLAPGGRAVLITDFVSSQTAAELRAGEPDWPRFLQQTATERNFFHTLHPWAVLAQLQNDPSLNQTISDARLTSCWRWDQGARLYAVAAFEFAMA